MGSRHNGQWASRCIHQWEKSPPWPRWHFRFPGRAQTREDPCKLFGGPNHEPISRNCIRDLPLRASSATKALSPVAQSPDRTWTVRFHIFGPNVRSRWAGRIDCTSYIYYFDSSLFFCVTFGCSLTPGFICFVGQLVVFIRAQLLFLDGQDEEVELAQGAQDAYQLLEVFDLSVFHALYFTYSLWLSAHWSFQ